MINLRHSPHPGLLLAFAVLCAVGTLRAQNFAPTPSSVLSSSPSALRLITDKHILASMAFFQPAPEYPPIARINYIEGPVQIEITVNSSGRVSTAHVLSGNPILAVASLKAVSNWIYHPLKTESGPVGFTAKVKLRFSLNHRGPELSPARAEKDFDRQVKPPQVVTPSNSNDESQAASVHMRVLVNEQGQVVDADAAHLDRSQIAALIDNLQSWTFHPARWGTLPIAAYFTVDVPINNIEIMPVASISVSP